MARLRATSQTRSAWASASTRGGRRWRILSWDGPHYGPAPSSEEREHRRSSVRSAKIPRRAASCPGEALADRRTGARGSQRRSARKVWVDESGNPVQHGNRREPGYGGRDRAARPRGPSRGRTAVVLDTSFSDALRKKNILLEYVGDAKFRGVGPLDSHLSARRRRGRIGEGRSAVSGASMTFTLWAHGGWRTSADRGARVASCAIFPARTETARA